MTSVAFRVITAPQRYYIDVIKEKRSLFPTCFIRGGGADMAAWILGGSGRKNFKGMHAALWLSVPPRVVWASEAYRLFKIPAVEFAQFWTYSQNLDNGNPSP